MMMKTNFAHRLPMLVATVAAAAVLGLGSARATPISTNSLQVDVTGIPDYDERGAFTNVIRDFQVGAGAFITAFAWNIDLTSSDDSYLSEMQLTFSDTVGNGVTFTPGGGDDFSGTMHYTGFQDLGGIGKLFAVGSDGILRLEFHDYYKDLPFDEPEGIWNAGTLTFSIAEVPEPATWALMLGGLLLLTSANGRRRPQH
jgi:hypothetical protein